MVKNWKTYKLVELAERVTVGFVGSMAKEYVDEGVPMLRSQNIKPFKLDFNNLKFISKKFHEKINKSSLKKDDVAIIRTGNPGTAAVIPEGINEVNCSDLVIVTPDTKKINPHFLCYYFNSVARGYVSSQLVGAVQQHFNVGSAKKMSINLPSIEEQLEIVNIIKNVQDKIELNLQMNKTLEAMAMALYKYWFVDFGPFQDGEFVDSELGKIPMGWELKKFEDFIEKIIDNRGKTPPLSKTKTDYLLFETYQLTRDSFFPKDFQSRKAKYVTEEIYNNLKWFRKGHPEFMDILFATVGNGIPNWSFMYENNGVGIAQNVVGIRPKNFISSIFLLCAFESKLFLQQFEGYVIRTAQPSIKLSDLNRIEMIFPKKEILENWSKIVEPHIKQVYLNYKENQTLTKLRNTLLPKLISGEVRVKEAAKIISQSI